MRGVMQEGFDLVDHLLQLCQPPPSTAPEGEEEGLRPALVVAPLLASVVPLTVLADELIIAHGQGLTSAPQLL